MIALSRPLWLIWVLALAGCSGDSPETLGKNEIQKPEVSVAEVQVWHEDKVRALPGVVRPGKRAVISTRMTGTLITVHVEPGDHVTAGQSLATVDSRAVESAISAAKSKLHAAESALRQAQRENERLQRLYEEDLIARVKMEQAAVRVQQLESQLQTAKAELQRQKTNLDYARLSAPFDGVISETLIDPGSFVGPGQALMVIESRDTLRIDVPVSSEVAATLRPGQRVSVSGVQDTQILSARVISVIPALDEASGQRLRLEMDRGSSGLGPGQVVTVLIPTENSPVANRERDWVALPKSALIRRGQLTGALVLNGGEKETAVHLKWIKIANPPVNGTDMIPVTEGLSPGDHVVLAPSSNLRDGQKVTINPAGADNGE